MLVLVLFFVIWERELQETFNFFAVDLTWFDLFRYAASFVLERSTGGSSFDLLYEAGRRGRSGDNCHEAYLECNEV